MPFEYKTYLKLHKLENTIKRIQKNDKKNILFNPLCNFFN